MLKVLLIIIIKYINKIPEIQVLCTRFSKRSCICFRTDLKSLTLFFSMSLKVKRIDHVYKLFEHKLVTAHVPHFKENYRLKEEITGSVSKGSRRSYILRNRPSSEIRQNCQQKEVLCRLQAKIGFISWVR